MKDFAGNEIDEPAMTKAIAAIDWSTTPTLAPSDPSGSCSRPDGS